MTPDADGSHAALLEFARDGSSASFARIVKSNIDLVYASALRQVRDPHLAEDVTQAVFIVLARRAKSLSTQTHIPGWLIKTTRYCALDALKRRSRQLHHEREAAAMKPVTSVETPDPSELSDLLPHLDAALTRLSAIDRSVIVMRYLEHRPLRDVAIAVGLSEVALRKRVGRAIEKLRAILNRSGVTMPAAGVALAMESYTAPSAPAALVGNVIGCAVGAAQGSSAAIAEAAIRMMHWVQLKFAAAIGGLALIVLATVFGASFIILQPSPAPAQRAQFPIVAGAPATRPQAGVSDLSPEQRRIHELLYELRLAKIPFSHVEWILPLRDLIQAGKPAVPAIVAELGRVQGDNRRRLLIIALRQIGDRRAIPALLAALPRAAEIAYQSSDYGIEVPEPELWKYLNDNRFQVSDRGPIPQVYLNRSITLCISALEALTDHSEGQYQRNTSATEFISRWQRWWDQEGKQLVTQAEIDSLEVGKGPADLVDLAGVAANRGLFPTGPDVRLTPVREVVLETVSAWDIPSYLDLDSGRVLCPFEGLTEPVQTQKEWETAAGIDVAGSRVTMGIIGQSFFSAGTRAIKAWQIPNERFNSIEQDLRNGVSLVDLSMLPPSDVVPRDPKTRETRYDQYPATFLVITEEGGKGILQMVESLKDGNAARIRFRMFEGIKIRRPALADSLAVPATRPAARFAFGDVREVTIEIPSQTRVAHAIDIDTGTARPVAAEERIIDQERRVALPGWLGSDLTIMPSPGHPLRLTSTAGGTWLVVTPQAWERLSADDINRFVLRRLQNQPMNLSRYDPPTYVFQTREGGRGVLQVISSTETTLKLRYRLVQDK